MSTLLVATTTFASKEDALALSKAVINQKLAACAQIEGPLLSVYSWKGNIEQEEEFRVIFKFPKSSEAALESFVKAHHPYENPQWIVFSGASASAEYLKWVQESCL